MAFPNIIKHSFTYPLVWVMLLWAVTLPGHELAVYGFLVKGLATEVAPVLRLAEQKEPAVKQQLPQVFVDAHISSTFVLNPQQAFRHSFLLFKFVPPVVNQPACRPQFLVAVLLGKILPASLQSNAP